MIPASKSPSLPVIQTPFCGDLRSKKFFMLDRLPADHEDFLDPSGHCWCYHTQIALGPDGSHAGPDHCGPGRSCYRSALSDPT
jgi:hypothetical protein